MTGAQQGEPGVHGFPTQHGAAELDKLSFSELIERHFDDEERAWWKSVPSDPMERLDIAIRYRFVAIGRVNRELARQRVRHNGVVPETKSLSYELTLDKISQTVARLEEVRAKYLETQSGNDTRATLRDFLRGLSDDDFAAAKDNPALLAGLIPTDL